MSQSSPSADEKPAPTVLRVSRPLLLILVTVFLNIMGLGLILPVLPFYATAYGADGTEVGLLFTAFSGMQFLASPVFGALSDRFGRRPIILLGLLGQALAYVLMGVANSLTMLFVSRIVSGVTAGNISATQAYVADVTPWQERTRAYGLVGAAFGAGLLFGPALGGVLTLVDPRAPAFGAAILVGLNLLFGYFMLGESLPAERRTTMPIAGQFNPFGVLVPLVGRPVLRGPLIATFLLNIALTAFQANFAVFAGAQFGLGPTEVAALFVATGLANILVQVVALPKLSMWFADTALVMVGSALNVLGELTTAFAPNSGVFWGSLPAITGGYSLSRGPLTSLITKLVAPTEQGMVNGGIQSTISLAGVVGPIAAGILYESVGSSAPYWGSAIAVGVAAAGIALRTRPAAVPAMRPAAEDLVVTPVVAVRNGQPNVARTVLQGTLDGVALLPLVHLMQQEHKSGSLRIWREAWSGELSFHAGQPVAASFGDELGPAALDAIVLLSHASFAFVECPTQPPSNLAMDPDELELHMGGVAGTNARLIAAICSPTTVPRVKEEFGNCDPKSTVTLMRATLKTLLAVDGTLTIGDIGARSGFAQTCQDLATLLDEGVIDIDVYPAVSARTRLTTSQASSVPAVTVS